MVRRGLRWFTGIVGAVLAALILGTVLPRPLFEAAAGSGPERLRILVLSSPIHTDIAVPAVALADPEFEFLDEAGLPAESPHARWVLFGWGGKAFYVPTPELTDIRLGPLLKSFTLDDSVMHVQVAGVIDEAEPFVSAHTISDEVLARLLAFIRESFAEADGRPSACLALATARATPSSRRSVPSTPCSAAIPGLPQRCAKRGSERDGGTRCRSRWAIRWSCTTSVLGWIDAGLMPQNHLDRGRGLSNGPKI